MAASAPTPGFHPPVSDNGIGQQQPLDLAWLSKPMVSVGIVDANTPFVSPALPRGGYVVWCSDASWVNAGLDGAAGVDHTVTSANAATPDALARAPKPHDGGQWLVPVNEGESITIKARQRAVDTTAGVASTVEFRIWEGL